MKNLKLLAVIAAIVSVPAGATTLTFNSLHKNDTTATSYISGNYKEAGYTLSTNGLCSGATCFLGVPGYSSIDKPGASLTTMVQNAPVTVTRDSGAAFLLQSIDLATYFPSYGYPPYSEDVSFSFKYADGTTGSAVKSFSTTAGYVPATLSFDLAPLLSFTFTTSTSLGGQFDNIVLADAPAAAVPEAATWAMMLVGFGAIGGALRRKRTGPSAIAM